MRLHLPSRGARFNYLVLRTGRRRRAAFEHRAGPPQTKTLDLAFPCATDGEFGGWHRRIL